MGHIIERTIMHMAGSVLLLLVLFFPLLYWVRHNRKVAMFVSPDKLHVLTLCAVLVAALAPLREPYDLFFGMQSFVKTPIDQASWFVFPALSVFGLYRFWRVK
jgi:hypothetical protein